MGARLLEGDTHFRVEELPAYLPQGAGEHLYVHIEKQGCTTDQVVAALSRTFQVRDRDIGVAGRKDRHAITSQWFSVLGGREEALAALPSVVAGGRVRVLATGRHRNKLRLGHLAGNRFSLDLDGVTDPAALATALAELARDGVPNLFGRQRFGVAGANVAVAAAWAAGDLRQAVALAVDASGGWTWGKTPPSGFRHGPEGRMLGALRHGCSDPAAVLRAAGEPWRRLIANAAQSAVFNAVALARQAAGLERILRPGDVGMLLAKGAPFLVRDDIEAADCCRRAAAGLLEVATTAPLPGSGGVQPSPAVADQEQSWAAVTGIPFAAFGPGQPLECHGERRPLRIPFLEPPLLEATGPKKAVLRFALGPGSYATTVLEALGVELPTPASPSPVSKKGAL